MQARYRSTLPNSFAELAPASPPKPSIERYRPPPKPKWVPAPKSTIKPKSAFDFTLIARQILLHPPLRHRGEPPEAGLSVFEFCIAVAATILARRTRASEAHDAGLRGGKRAMTAKRNSQQPVHCKAMMPPREQFEAVGSAGFDRGRAKWYEDHASENRPIETTRNELLSCVGLSRKGENNSRVSEALDRLTRAVRQFPSVLASWSEADAQTLKLVVRHEWLALSRFGHVPLPLPTSGPVVLALYLFLTVVNPRPRGAIRIAAKALYKQLGIRTDRPTHNERALRQALACVNAHRRKLGLQEFDLSSEGKGGWRFTVTSNRAVKSNSIIKRKFSATLTQRSVPRSKARASGWDDEEARLDAAKEDREAYRRSLALADDEYIDDDEIDERRRQERSRRELERRRELEEQDREYFAMARERLTRRS